MEDLAAYGEFRSATLLDWHPVRREVLITTRFGDVPQIHRVAQPGGARTQLTFFPDRVSGARYEPTAGSTFFFGKDVGGAEWFQIYLYDTRTGRSNLLTDGKSRNTGPIWAKSGKWIVFSSTRRNGKDSDVYTVDPANPQSTRMVLQADTPGWFTLDTSPDDRSLLVVNRKSAVESTLYTVDVQTGAKTRLTPEQTDVSYASGEFTPDGRGIYLITTEGSEFYRLAYMDLGTRRLTYPLPDLKYDVEGLEVSRDGRHVAYVVNEAGSGTLHVWDTAAKKEVALPKIPLGDITALRWHKNNRDLGFSLTSARSPADVYSIDITAAKLERWTTGETGGLDASQFVEPELIRWKSFDGQSISGFYYAAPKRFTGPRPVVINIHGGPEGQSRPVYLGVNNYLLSELGVSLIYPNVRGSTGYGKTFLNLDNGRKREDSVKDIGALLDWIATRPEVDAARVMVMGGSYGGYMTLASMTHFNDRLRCAADTVGISNWITFLEHTEAYRRDLRRVEYGDERDPQMRDFLSSISPMSHVKKITKPMLVVQGRNDPRVPYTESEQMVEALRGNGAPVWYILASDEGHGFAKKKNRDYQFASLVLFMQKYLLN
jgi:dipeptidyl aminopeptidase/acylaminoacyl peptidase